MFSVRVQTEYLDTRKIRITLHRLTLDVSEGRLEDFLPNIDGCRGHTGEEQNGCFHWGCYHACDFNWEKF